jgi:hypothetical protein
VDSVRWARTGVLYAVGVDQRVADARGRQVSIEARVVRTLGEPHALRRAPDECFEAAHAELELRPNSLARGEEPRQVAVRRGTGEKLEPARVPVMYEAGHHIAAVAIPRPPHLRELLSVEGRDGSEERVSVEPLHLALGERLKPRKVGLEPQAKEVVLQHGGERRRHAHRKREGDALLFHAIEGVEEREVALDERFVEPPFLEVPLVLGVAH